MTRQSEIRTKALKVFFAVALSVFLILPAAAFAGDSPWGGLLDNLKKSLSSGGLSEDEIAKGLKHALEVGTKNAVAQVGVTRTWQKLEGGMRKVPFLAESVRFDLDRYVTERALDGLFLVLAEEEQKIRTDPAARVTELLEKVFKKR